MLSYYKITHLNLYNISYKIKKLFKEIKSF